MSLSSRRAWIEISKGKAVKSNNLVALLTESVDWNFNHSVLRVFPIMSLSSRRAWIEIARHCTRSIPRYVALLTESVDWNIYNQVNALLHLGRSPHGERGLKCSLMMLLIYVVGCRSPHGERGLKLSFVSCGNSYWLSLSSRRAWIEIFECEVKYYWWIVALLTESVDWNLLVALSPMYILGRSPHGERGLK